VLYCYELQKMSYHVCHDSLDYVVLCASLVLQSRKCFSCSTLFAPNHQYIYIYIYMYIYNVVCFAHEKTPPTLNNLVVSKCWGPSSSEGPQKHD
jgi:hypothetical protein